MLPTGSAATLYPVLLSDRFHDLVPLYPLGLTVAPPIAPVSFWQSPWAVGPCCDNVGLPSLAPGSPLTRIVSTIAGAVAWLPTHLPTTP